MDRKKLNEKICNCPPRKQPCHHSKNLDRKNVAEIIEALSYDPAKDPDVKKAKGKQQSRVSIRSRRMGPSFSRQSDNSVPMKPPMDARLRYIGHCPNEPPRPLDYSMVRKYYCDVDEFSDDEPCGIMTCPRKKRCQKKRVSYYEDKGDIVFPVPTRLVKHTDSDKSIVHLPSPKLSGEQIRTQNAVVDSQQRKPPLPAKSGHDLFQPHSGIIFNKEPYFVPENLFFGGSGNVPLPSPPTVAIMCGKSTICHKGGLCGKGTCRRKKCRRIAIMRKNQISKRVQMRNEKHINRYYAKQGVTDGKLRPRSKNKSLEQDDGCGLDEIPKPEHVKIPPNLKKGAFETHSLTVLPCTKDKKPVHYGIITGSFSMYDTKFSARSRGRQALTMSVMSYCLAFHYHPKQWTMKLIDNLLEAGDKWFLQCADKVHDHSSVQGMCEVLPFGKKQILVLNKKRMQILLGEPEIVGYTMSQDPTVYNLCRGLKAFFKENKAAILLTRVLKVVIWKDKVCYYLFDPAGRDSRAYSNYTKGAAALVNVKDLESVAEVLLARSVVEDQKFVLAPVKLVKMIDEKEDDDLESDKELTLAEKAMMGYRILNENCAIVNANMHLGDRCFEEAKYRQSLTIAVMALTYAKISPPNTWFTKTLDKILRLGNKLFVDCTNPKVMIDLSIDNVPNEIIVGPYACEIIIYRERVKGQLFTTKECLFNIKTGLKDFFSKEYNSGILQFNNYSLAVWRQKDMYYLFDPYPRSNDGLSSPKGGKSCVLMMLNPEAMAAAFIKNWDYMPTTTQFYIHAFKVLKLKKRDAKMQILCTLSDEHLPGKKVKKEVLRQSKSRGDFGGEMVHDVLPMEVIDVKPFGAHADEEQMGDIVSLVDSIQEDYLPPVPLRYRNAEPPPWEERVVNLDSPTVSVTQVVPPWPKPRDKTGEEPDLDPEPEPEPVIIPPPPPKPEGWEEEELGEEEELARQKMLEEKKRLEEEERRKPLDLPPPLNPPPTPQPEPELASPPPLDLPPTDYEDEIQCMEPIDVDRRILLAEDAKYRHALREQRKKISQPLAEYQEEIPPTDELEKTSNFKKVLDGTEMIRTTTAIDDIDVLPFAAIMAIVTSYKYSISTWSASVANFVIDSAKKLYTNKKAKFKFAAVHVIPKIALGKQAYQATIDVADEAPTWRLTEVLKKYFSSYDRGMITTSSYSCAVFKKNGLFYLFDSSSLNGLGMRYPTSNPLKGEKKPKILGKGAFMRFKTLRELCDRIIYNKDGPAEDQQFILSRIVVRRLLMEPRMKLPEDYDYSKQASKDEKKSKMIYPPEDKSAKSKVEEVVITKSTPGYKFIDGLYRIQGTTSLKDRGCGSGPGVKACHFVSLIAMLMATMHPIRSWDPFMVDMAVEKGVEVYEKATNLLPCEKRVIKNIIIDGKFVNVNIKKIVVINDNINKNMEQYIKAVTRRLRYMMIKFPQTTFVLCQVDGFYHLFDPYPSPPVEDTIDKPDKNDPNAKKDDKGKKPEPKPKKPDPKEGFASWILFRSLESVVYRLRKTIFKGPTIPQFYTFELTSVKVAPLHAAINYRLSPQFRPDENPNAPYLKVRKIRPVVDEKMYWLSIEMIPWSRMNPLNDLGFERGTPQTVWKSWEIEFPGDLFSLWGCLHIKDHRFEEAHRGRQVLAVTTVALAMVQACELSAWNSNILDGIVVAGDQYFKKCADKNKDKKNIEMMVTDLEPKFDDLYPYSFTVKFEKVIFGFVYNMYPDRFNLSKALLYFFEKYTTGILVSPGKNLGFGRIGTSYFMFDCQSHGAPVFIPGQGSAYMLKCESLNRLIYCMTITMNVRRHGSQFHLFSAAITIQEKAK